MFQIQNVDNVVDLICLQLNKCCKFRKTVTLNIFLIWLHVSGVFYQTDGEAPVL